MMTDYITYYPRRKYMILNFSEASEKEKILISFKKIEVDNNTIVTLADIIEEKRKGTKHEMKIKNDEFYSEVFPLNTHKVKFTKEYFDANVIEDKKSAELLLELDER